MEYTIAPLSSGHRKDVIDIFNYYIENSFAAYPEKKVPYQLLDMFVQSDGFPAGMIKDDDDTVAGFGMLRAHNPMPTFSNTAEVTYFIDPRHTGKGLGQMLLTFLESGAIERGIEIILASISSLITGSIRFHLKSGFTECGRFRRIGMKNGQEFDVLDAERTAGLAIKKKMEGESMKLNRMDHISIAVKSLDEARRTWEPLLGKSEPDDQYVDESERIRVARYRIGEVGFELMESTASDGPVAAWIRKNGEGVMVVSFNVDNTHEAVEELKSKDYRFIADQNGKTCRSFSDCEFAFIHPGTLNGVLTELIDCK